MPFWDCRIGERALIRASRYSLVSGALVAGAAWGCGTDNGGDAPLLGTSRSQLDAWAAGSFSQVLRVNPGETLVRNICEVTIPLSSMKPLTVTASAGGASSPLSLGWMGSAVAIPGLAIDSCPSYPCDLIARWRNTSGNGSPLGCEVAVDDGISRVTGESSGTALTVSGAPSAPVIFNQDVTVGQSGSALAGSCVLRESALVADAAVADFHVFVNGGERVGVPGPISVGSVPWPSPGPAVPFGTLNVGSESGATRLKHVAPRKEDLVEGDALRCAGAFSHSGQPVFDVNVSGAATGNGVSIAEDVSAWTCSPASFGGADGCDCGCGILDPDCLTASWQSDPLNCGDCGVTCGDDATCGCSGGSCSGGTIYFSEDFSDNSRGWTLGTEWAIGPAQAGTGQQQGFPDPAVDHSASADNGVAGIVIGGNYAPLPLHSSYYLTSPLINLIGAPGTVRLTFWRYLNADWDPFTTQTVEVFNGTSWVTVWTNAALGNVLITDSAWTRFEFDVTAFKNANFQVRFGHRTGMQSQFAAYIMSGWNVDDVSLGSGICL